MRIQEAERRRRQTRQREEDIFDPNKYLDEMFDDYIASHQVVVEEEEVDLVYGNGSEESSGIGFGEGEFEAWWEFSFGEGEGAGEGEGEGEEVDTIESHSEETRAEDADILFDEDIVFEPRELT
jgi:hypothetical protein